MTTLYGWGPMFGLPGPSPFVMKADIQLQMLGVPFERQVADLESVSKHKAPYVEDDGEIIQDSTFIRMHFEQKLGRDLNEGLSDEQRACAWAMERLLEDRLVLALASERWLVDENFYKGPAMFFMDVPEPARQQVMDQVRRDIREAQTGQGWLRHSREERMMLAERDIAAVSTLLGEKDFMFGEEPSALDAAAFGVVASCGTPFFDTPLVGIVDKFGNLRAYLDRMQARYFAETTWPAMAA